jgi:hypothetical protein
MDDFDAKKFVERCIAEIPAAISRCESRGNNIRATNVAAIYERASNGEFGYHSYAIEWLCSLAVDARDLMTEAQAVGADVNLSDVQTAIAQLDFSST